MKGRHGMVATAAPYFSVLIVNYNGARFLPACLESLRTQTWPRDRSETILLDNASGDDSLHIVRTQFPWVKLLPESRNIGFAEGNNLAVRAARGEVIVLLNNDTIPDPFWLEELARAIAENPGCIVGSKLVFAGESAKINSAGLFLLRDGRGADRGFGQTDSGQYERGGDIFAACAAAVAIPRAMLREPLFDRDYFLYSEDLEEAWAGQRAGRRTVLAPRAVVRHFVGASAGDQSPLFHYYVERNRTLTALRHGDPFLVAYSLSGLLIRALRATAMCILRRSAPKYRRPAVKAIWRAFGDVLTRTPAILKGRFTGPARGPR